MQTYEITVRGRSVSANSTDTTLVRTSVGIDQVRILFDDAEWTEFPVTVTFGNGNVTRTSSVIVSAIQGSDEWVAQATATVPFEVLRETGPLRVTLQGTDSSGRHIITAAGAPLYVEEAGDVTLGDVPEDAPTVDEWQQAYADAQEVVSRAAALVSSLQESLASMVSDASSALDDRIAESYVPATKDSLGVIRVGDGLGIDDGELYVTSLKGMTESQVSQLANLASLAYYCFDTSFDEDGYLRPDAKVKVSAIPVASITSPGVSMPDGTSVTVDGNGILHFVGNLTHEWDGTTLTVTSSAGSTSADLVGPLTDISEATATIDQDGDLGVEVTVGGTPAQRTLSFAFSGLKGEKGDTGPQGPSGYVLTSDDIDAISDEILSRYALEDGVRY